MQLFPEFQFQFRLSAGRVDSKAGIIYGATVGKLGVEAIGKILMLDAQGKRTLDPDKAKTKLSIVTDEKTLVTMYAAIQKAGAKLKVRSDHSDSLSARGGFATNFSREADRIACDIHLNDSYKDRAIVLETALVTLPC